MSRLAVLTRVAASFLIITSMVIAGCSDLPTAEPATSLADGASSKFHHAHLLDRTTTGVAGKGRPVRDDVNLIVGFSSRDVNVMKIVRRWKVVQRWKVVTRWNFTSVFHGIAFSIPRANLEEFLARAEGDPEISWVQPDPTVRLPYQVTGQLVHEGQLTPWGVSSVGADRSSVVSGDGVEPTIKLPNIFLLDTGASHADLNVVRCLEVMDGDVTPCRVGADVNGHGTEVIGFAAARDNNSGIVGVAPGAPVHVIKVLNDQGEGHSSDVIVVIDYLTRLKRAYPGIPMLVNLSLGADAETTSYIALDVAVEQAIEAGIVFVVAAGNDGNDASTYSPAHVPGAITVGAYGKQGNMPRFSNYGPTVDILAPGENVEALSTGGYAIMTSGTSHATAWVTGAAALVLARNPHARPAEVQAALVSSASPSIVSRPGTTNRGLDVSGL